MAGSTDQILAKMMDEANELEMTDLFRADLLEHARRVEAGRRFFFGEDEEESPAESGWLKGFVRINVVQPGGWRANPQARCSV